MLVGLIGRIGPIMQQNVVPPEPFPHNMEPQLRKLGLSSKLERGVPTLANEHVVCKEGDVLNSEQVGCFYLCISSVHFRC